MGEDLTNHQIRFAVLGLGKIATTRFIPACQEVQGAQIVALGTRSPEKVSLETLRVSPEVIVVTYDEVLQQDEVDAVYIALPNDLHVEWIEKAAAVGKHVLCEKPLAATYAQARSCADACERAGVILAEAFMYRHDPRQLKVRELIEAGAIGEIRSIHASFSYVLEDLRNIRLSREHAGGALMDVGCYGIDIARFLTGESPLSAAGLANIGQRSSVDELISLSLRFPSGVIATVEASTHSCRHHSYRVRGTLGEIKVPNSFVPKPNEDTRIVLNTTGEEPCVYRFAPADMFAYQLDCFVKAIMQGDAGAWTPGDNGVETARALELARTSLDGHSFSVDYLDD